MKITVSTFVEAPVGEVWRAYTTPEDIRAWNAASADWHTVSATSDLRPGGAFCYRMEARDKSFGFDFAGEFTEVAPGRRLAYAFGGRQAVIDFDEEAGGVRVTVNFDGEPSHSEDQQRSGWQAILDNFARHVRERGRGR